MQQAPSVVNQSSDPVDVATNVLTSTNGDAKAAFYKLAEQKGVDPNQFLSSLSSLGNPTTLIANMMKNNPQVGNLFRLFGAIK